MGTKIEIPEISVVALVGASGSGKSSFCKKYFKPTEVLSSDYFRSLICDDENNQKVTSDAFESLYYIANKRLNLGFLTVIDATNVLKESRESITKLAKDHNCHSVAIVLNMPDELCLKRNEQGRKLNPNVIKRQNEQLKRSIKHLKRDGFRHVYVVNESNVNNIEIIRKPIITNKRDISGSFDIIGDIHGCYDELCELLEKLNYQVDKNDYTATHTENRKVVFLGDLCDRGNKNVPVLKLVMNMVKNEQAYCVLGNHDAKLLKKLSGSNVKLTNGLENTMGELENESEKFRQEVNQFIDSLISHYVFDNGKLVVAHAGVKENYQGRNSGKVKNFCIYGDITGETDEYGLPVRLPWANDYKGSATVVYGHTPSPEPQIINNIVCIDTGCVFGGKLTCYRYPERKIVQVNAYKEYYKPAKPLHPIYVDDDIININDIMVENINTSIRQNIKIRSECSITALEVMSRFAVDPHWLIYLPPTMSPCETSNLEDYLEHPIEAFEYYKTRNINKVICEQKHMGSRAVIVLCKNIDVAKNRFKVSDNSIGVIYTRTGKSFFNDDATQNILLERLSSVLTTTNFWDDFKTDWVCLDTELMPWSAKALSLLEEQYASVGRAGRTGLSSTVDALEKAINLNSSALSENSVDLNSLLGFYKDRKTSLELYTKAYRDYCWDVNSINDYLIAPFHILATEDKLWANETHETHMKTIKKYMTGIDEIFMATPYLIVDLLDENSIKDGVNWWNRLTESGGEGMVVKPIDFIAYDDTELLQPAIKCRGREYLRIIYGPEYTLKNNLLRLKKRSLKKKRNLALNEFALGMESIYRFVRKEPLHRVHQCAFGVLALESEPVDPRL